MYDYYLPNSWYEPDDDYEQECLSCNEKEKNIEVATNYLKCVIENLYNNEKPIDLYKLQMDLNNLCFHLGFDSVSSHLPDALRSDHSQQIVKRKLQIIKNIA